MTMTWRDAISQLHVRGLSAAAEWMEKIGMQDISSRGPLNTREIISRNLADALTSAFNWSDAESTVPGSLGYWDTLRSFLLESSAMDARQVRLFSNPSLFMIWNAMYNLEEERGDPGISRKEILKGIAEYFGDTCLVGKPPEFFSSD